MASSPEPIRLTAVQAGYADLIVRRFIAAGYPADVGRAAVVNAWAESRLDPSAVSPAGNAVGLFQLHDRGLGAGMTVAERQDPGRNIDVILKIMPRWGAKVVQAHTLGHGVPELARLFSLHVERPGRDDAERAAIAAKRADYARRIYGVPTMSRSSTTPTTGFDVVADARRLQTIIEDRVERVVDRVAASADPYRAKVQEFGTMLDQARGSLERMRADIALYEQAGGKHGPAYRASYNTLTRAYNVLADGFSPHVTDAQGQPVARAPLPTFDGAPVVMIAVAAGVMAVSVAGVAWAVAAWEWAQATRDQARVQADELAARVEAMRTGQTLQPATVPPPDPPGSNDVLPWIIGGLLVVGGAAALPLFLRRG